jgi:hypothetical protein
LVKAIETGEEQQQRRECQIVNKFVENQNNIFTYYSRCP